MVVSQAEYLLIIIPEEYTYGSIINASGPLTFFARANMESKFPAGLYISENFSCLTILKTDFEKRWDEVLLCNR